MRYVYVSANGGKIHIADPLDRLKRSFCGIKFSDKCHTEHVHSEKPNCKRCIDLSEGPL